MPTQPVPLTRFLPSGALAAVVARRLADSIQVANRASAAKWGVTQRDDFLRLNVGRIEVLTVTPTYLRLFLASDVLPSTNPPNPDDYELVVRDKADASKGYYKSVPTSMLCAVDLDTCSNLAAVIERFEQAHIKLIQKACLTPRNPMTAKSHSASIVDQLSVMLELRLPQPKYS